MDTHDQQPGENDFQHAQSLCVELGECVAVISEKYSDRPLLGRVTAVFDEDIQMDWMVGTYSGVWRE